MQKQIIIYPIVLLLISMAFNLSAQQKADRSQYPTTGPLKGLDLPAIQTFELDNGLAVYLVEKRDLPIAQFVLSFNAGSIHDPADKTGLAQMTADMMDEGAGDYDALALSEEIDFLGIDLGVYAGREQLNLRLFTPTATLDRALPLFVDVLLKPRFEEKDLDRKRAETLVSLTQAHDEARTIASTAFQQMVFGESHPYGRSAEGTEKSLRAMRTEDLENFHREYITPANGYLIVVGDLTETEIRNRFNPLLKNWNGGTIKSLEIPEPKKQRGFDIYLIDKPGAAQSELRFGHAGVSRLTEDHYPIEVVNTILGGSFTSRLNQNIREEHGYAYGARSYFFQPRETGFFLAYAAVQTDVTDKAIQEFMKELNGIHSIPEADLEKARNYAALSFPGEFQSVQQIAGNLSDIVFYDLPQDWLNHHMKRLLNVDRTAAERAARTYVTPDRMVLVVVGDKAKIADKIEALKLGEIHYLSKEDVLGPLPN